MENAAEAIGSSYIEAGCLVRIGDRRRHRVQRAGVRDALVGPTGVVELLKLAQGMCRWFQTGDRRVLTDRLDTPRAPGNRP
ncbi:hypothetical protein ACIQFZ_28930 [Streptomyces sp. NPDC093064]|uniref:hypothetical protein n=1 Tax=Streptomyces sp. NPDC093064 TaxID=3366020 RepID=UPI00381AE636